MAVVNTEVGFVFLAHPHTASRATTTALMQIEGSQEVAYHHADLQRVINHCPDASSCETIFTIVRHPFDWLVSRFHCNGGNRGEWDKWVRKRPRRMIFDKFLGQTTTFGKFESLESDLARLTGHQVTLEVERDHVTRGKPKNHLDYWQDLELRSWALNHFAQDFEIWQYENPFASKD